ncbi:hypothetical protein [Sphaerotilus sp.]|uniref:hypothetical protein n=1 Tax=Sphaerotilus sp. TaxID=2093942 RepID=UPI0034E2E736
MTALSEVSWIHLAVALGIGLLITVVQMAWLLGRPCPAGDARSRSRWCPACC